MGVGGGEGGGGGGGGVQGAGLMEPGSRFRGTGRHSLFQPAVNRSVSLPSFRGRSTFITGCQSNKAMRNHYVWNPSRESRPRREALVRGVDTELKVVGGIELGSD